MEKKENMLKVKDSQNIETASKAGLILFVCTAIYKLMEKAIDNGYNFSLDVANKIKLDVHK